jgi:hypothetical protein
MMAALCKWLVERLSFHRTEGALAHFAQTRSERLGYVSLVLLTGITGILLIAAAIGILLPTSALAGICIGVAVGLAIPFSREIARIWWRAAVPIRGLDLVRYRRAPITGGLVSALVGLICAIIPQENYVDTIFAGSYVLVVVLLLGQVNPGTVRYLTMVGHSSTSMLRIWLPIQVVLLAPLAGVLAVSQRWAGAGLVLLFVLGLPAITALRVFAYRAFSRLLADWMVAAVVATALYTALTLPPIGPIVIIAATILVARRGSASRWLLT